MLQLCILTFATLFLWVGFRGVMGWPDSRGVKTTRAMTIACFVIAGFIVCFAIVILPAWLDAT